jgi:competence factor transporting protein
MFKSKIRTLKYRKYYSPQLEERDCGIAALNMIGRFYGSNYSQARLRALAGTDVNGTTALGIKFAAEQLGFTIKAGHATPEILNEDSQSFPFIAHVLKGNLLHYYVVFHATSTMVTIGDPDSSVGITELRRDQFLSQWSDVVLILRPGNAYQVERDINPAIRTFISLINKNRKLIAITVICAAITTGISVLSSFFLQRMVDIYIPQRLMNVLSIISVGLIFCYLVQALLHYIQGIFLTILGQRLTIDVTLRYIEHIFKLPMSFFSTRRIGEIVSRFTDANSIIDALGDSIMTIFLDAWIVILIGFVLGTQNLKLFFFSLSALPVYAIIVYAFHKPFAKLNQECMESNAVMSASVIEDISGMSTIKAMNAENQSVAKIRAQFHQLLQKNLVYAKIDLSQQAMKIFLKTLLNIVILWMGAKLVISNQISLGQLFAYNSLLVFFTDPLESIIDLQAELQSARVANNRLDEVFQIETEDSFSRPITNIKDIIGPIQFNDVSFRYGFNPFVLKHISLTIKPGDKLTVVGMSGSGKTTMESLLVGYIENSEEDGEILLNGNNIRNVNRALLRNYIVYVPQEAFIFSGTLWDNLTLGGQADLSEQDVINACKTAQIYDEIQSMPERFNRRITESGNDLSGGQKQRLALARALLSPAKVLIFDESTSNLDTVTERRIVDGLMKLENRTLIFVAHRLTIAKMTDNIVVLDHGRVMEHGSHEKLLNSNGYYAALYNE